MRVEKTVFISYRRTNVAWALAVYQYLSRNGYDVFFDFTSIPSGDFEQIIIGNIKARAHFLLILTPSALERVNEPNDWLRREIETAIDEKRNIVPLMLEGFDYGSPAIAKYLTGKLAVLARYNAVRVPIDYFEEAMARICSKHLNIPLELVIHPASPIAQAAAIEEKHAANREETVTQKELTAQEWYEKGLEAKDNNEKIRFYDEAIRLKPDYAEAFCYRGEAKRRLGNVDGAIEDTSKAISLKPDFASAYNNRGVARKAKGDNDGAIADYSEAIHLKSDYVNAYYNRGLVYRNRGKLSAAIADYQKYLDLGGGMRDGDQAEVEQIIQDLKAQL